MDTFYDQFTQGRGENYVVVMEKCRPKYQLVLSHIGTLLHVTEVREVLDLGCGVGNLEEAVLERLPFTHITALDTSEAMLTAAHNRLGDTRQRVQLVHSDMRSYTPRTQPQAIVASFSLSSLSPADKLLVLQRAQEQLPEEGYVIIADRVRHRNERIEAAWKYARVRNTLAQNVSLEFVQQWCEHEEDEHAITTEQLLDIGKRARLRNRDVVYAADNVVLLCMQK